MRYIILFSIQVFFIGFTNAQWSIHQLETTNDFISLHFLNADTGFVGGYGQNTDNSILYKTTDGGKSWDRISIVGPKTIEDIYFANDTTGYLLTYASNKYMYKTTDGGDTWNSTTLEHMSFEFSGDGLGFIFTDQGIPSFSKRTFDNGATWETYGRSFDILSNNYVSAIDFLNNQSNVIYVVAGGGEVYKSTDKGDNWVKLRDSDKRLYYDIEFVTENTGYILGRDSLLRTDDGGANWRKVFEANTEHGDLVIINEKEFVLMTRHGIYYTKDGWETSTYTPAPEELLNVMYMNAIQQIDSENFCIVADGGYFLKFNVNDITALSDFTSKTNHFRIYPNPASDHIRLAGNQQGTLELLSLSGEVIYSEVVKSNQNIDLSPFDRGCYLVRFSNKTESQLVKLLVE